MKKKILTGIMIIIILLGLISCESKKHKQIKAMIEVGEYAPAILLLNAELLEDVKNIELRKMLLVCYEEQDLWDQVINQIHIINRINPEINYDFLLLRAYSINHQFDDAKMIYKKYEHFITDIDIKYYKEVFKKISSMEFDPDSLMNIKIYYTKLDPDSLNQYSLPWFNLFNGDSLSEKKFRYYITKNNKTVENELNQFCKDKSIQDLMLFNVLFSLSESFIFDYEIERLLSTDSTYINYLIPEFSNYLLTLEKPSEEGYWKARYHEKRMNIFHYLGDFDAEINEVEELIFDYELNLKYDSFDAFTDSECESNLLELYTRYVDILKLNSSKQQIQSFLDNKLDKHKENHNIYKELIKLKLTE